MVVGLVDYLITGLIEGGLLDAVTLGTAFAYAVLRWAFTAKKGPLISSETGLHVIHGLPIVPLLLLVISGFGSDAALTALLHTHRVILAAAGAAALLTILEQRPL
jgi:hypothetical protein